DGDDRVARIQVPFFYWLGCKQPVDRQRLAATRKGNAIELEATGTAHGFEGVTILLSPSPIDPSHDVVVTGGGKELYRGRPVPDAWTVLETLDARMDRALVFDRRIEL